MPTLVPGDGRHAVAAAEARHPLEPLLGVQRHDQHRDVHLQIDTHRGTLVHVDTLSFND